MSKRQQSTSFEPQRRGMLATMKASAEFVAWFRELLAYLRMPGATVIEHALIEFAKKSGFPKQPPPR